MYLLEQILDYSWKRIKSRNWHNELLSASFQGVKILFILAYFIASDDPNNEAAIKTIKDIFFQEGKLIIVKY